MTYEYKNKSMSNGAEIKNMSAVTLNVFTDKYSYKMVNVLIRNIILQH